MLKKMMTIMFIAAMSLFLISPASAGVTTVTAWYQGEVLHYVDGGIERGNSGQTSEIYLIGGNRVHQANIFLHAPGEDEYSPHWNVNVVHTADGVTVQDIIDAGFASELFDTDPVLFDDAADVLGAESVGLVELVQPGIVVLCPVVNQSAAESPGNNQLPDDEFEPFVLDEGF